MSSPVGVVNVEDSKSVGSQGVVEESHVGDVGCSHADVGIRVEEREKSGEGGGFAGGPEVARNVDSLFSKSVAMGPSEFPVGIGSHANPFIVGLGGKSSSVKERRPLGHRVRKAHSSRSKETSPGECRPLKRPRPEVEESRPGFGFVDFWSAGSQDEGGIGGSKSNDGGVFDLNRRAESDLQVPGLDPSRNGDDGGSQNSGGWGNSWC
ncbi:hypothetical protein Hanom_Chr01g00017271 [Helianthus anomalus]